MTQTVGSFRPPPPPFRNPGYGRATPLTVRRAAHGREHDRVERPAAEHEALIDASVGQRAAMDERKDVGESVARHVARAEGERRPLGEMVVLQRAAQLQPEDAAEHVAGVARSEQAVRLEGPPLQREDDALRVADRVREQRRLIPDVRVVLGVERHVDERPAERPVEVADAVVLVVELPLAGRRQVAAGEEPVARAEFRQRVDETRLVGVVDHHVQVVVPRYEAVVPVGADQRAAEHEEGDVGGRHRANENVERHHQRRAIARRYGWLEERLDRPQAFVELRHEEEQVDEQKEEVQHQHVLHVEKPIAATQ